MAVDRRETKLSIQDATRCEDMIFDVALDLAGAARG